ncbi:MAG TPA: DNA topoisomerase I, partial [Armatimonadetes bacterium]|nr:DNA topoisomerase I [Armatimonadota bacterium]
VFKKGNELVPTWTAFAVIQLLEEWFSELVDLGFTASMEDELDEIAEGDRDAVKQLKAFYFGTQQRPGIDAAVKEKGADIPFPLIPLSEEIRVRIGRNGPFIQRGEGGPGHTCSVPEDLPPADLTLEKAESLLTERAAGPESLGIDHKTGRNVYLKSGRYGAYLEREAGEDGEVKRVTLPPGANASELSEDDLSMLMSFPRLLGDEPGTQFAVTLAIGRYGAYLTAGDRKANVGDWRTAATMTLQEALDALANPQNNRGGRGARSSGPEPLRSLGTAEGLAGEVKVMSGRYGPYVT